MKAAWEEWRRGVVLYQSEELCQKERNQNSQLWKRSFWYGGEDMIWVVADPQLQKQMKEGIYHWDVIQKKAIRISKAAAERWKLSYLGKGIYSWNKEGSMKIDRLIGILSVLLQQDKTTAPELAEKFEVSRRTIHRDIEALCKAGIPICTIQGSGGGIRIMEGYRVDRTLLSSKDMQMILAGLRSLDSVSGSSYYGQLMEKLKTGSFRFCQRSRLYPDRSLLLVQGIPGTENLRDSGCHRGEKTAVLPLLCTSRRELPQNRTLLPDF